MIANGDSIVQRVIQTKKWNNVNVNVKIIVSAEKSWSPNTCICENSKYVKIISDDSKIVCDEIISVMDIVSGKMTNSIATNVTATSS